MNLFIYRAPFQEYRLLYIYMYMYMHYTFIAFFNIVPFIGQIEIFIPFFFQDMKMELCKMILSESSYPFYAQVNTSLLSYFNFISIENKVDFHP